MADTPPAAPVYERHSQGLESIVRVLQRCGVRDRDDAARRGYRDPSRRRRQPRTRAAEDKNDEILSFFINFLVPIGYYWLAHHRFVAQLVAIDTAFMIAQHRVPRSDCIHPFPTALSGVYSGHPISVVMYALTLGAASFMEVMTAEYLLDRWMKPADADDELV